jgi:hypothetical protein
MVFDRTPSARRLPNLDRMRAIDAFFTCVLDPAADEKKVVNRGHDVSGRSHQ